MNCTPRSWYLFRFYRNCTFSLDAKVLAKPRHWHRFGEQRRFLTQTESVELTRPTDIDFKALTNGDTLLEKKLKVLFLEVDISRQEGGQVPSNLKTEDWKELLNLETRTARKKFLTFCWKKEIRKNNEKKKKEVEKLKRIELVETQKDIPNEHLKYGLGGNTLFMRIRETTMTNFFNAKLIEAMLFSQELVVDCGYDNHMTGREARNCGKQLMLLFSENRMHINPFNLYFCSARRKSWSMQEFEKIIPTAFEPHFPLNVTEESYLELFPKERLVYLTPHCREELVEYDHNAVYIIGGLVDKAHSEPLSLARAKEQGLKMAKLPLDRYFLWSSGRGKNLTLNQMILILLDLRLTGDWKTALKHVPSRKVQKEYKVDYSADRFKLIENDNAKGFKTKDFYNNLLRKQ